AENRVSFGADDDRRAGGEIVRLRGRAVDGDDGRRRMSLAVELARRERRVRLVAVARRQRLQKYGDETVAADAEPEQLVGAVAQVVSDGGRHARRDDAARMLGEVTLEATAAHEAAIV